MGDGVTAGWAPSPLGAMALVAGIVVLLMDARAQAQADVTPRPRTMIGDPNTNYFYGCAPRSRDRPRSGRRVRLSAGAGAHKTQPGKQAVQVYADFGRLAQCPGGQLWFYSGVTRCSSLIVFLAWLRCRSSSPWSAVGIQLAGLECGDDLRFFLIVDIHGDRLFRPSSSVLMKRLRSDIAPRSHTAHTLQSIRVSCRAVYCFSKRRSIPISIRQSVSVTVFFPVHPSLTGVQILPRTC